MFPSPARRGLKSQPGTSKLSHPSSSPTALPRPSNSVSLKQSSAHSRSLSASSSVPSPLEPRPRLRPPSKNKHPNTRPYSAVNPTRARPFPQCQTEKRFSTCSSSNPLDLSTVSEETPPDSSPRLALPPPSKRSLDATNLPSPLGIVHNSPISSAFGPDLPLEPLHSRPLSIFHSMASTLLSGQQDPFAHPLHCPPDPLVLSQLDPRDELISALQSLVGPSRLESLVHLPTLRQPLSDDLPPLVSSAPVGPTSSLPSKPTTPQNSKRFLKRLGWRSRLVAPKTTRPPSSPDPPASGKPSLVPFRLIGVPLSHTAPASCITVIGGQKHLLPVMIFKTVEEIYSRGMRTSGLFRISGNSARIEALLSIFESPPSYGDSFSLHDETVFDICGLLRRFLCALPKPLLDPILSELFWNACVDEHQGAPVHLLTSRIAAAQIIFRLLPKREFSLLVYVTAFLSQVLLFPENKATLVTIGRIFGPALLAPRNGGVLGLGPSSPHVVQPQPPSARQLGTIETTRRAAEGLIWLLNHWNQITDGLLDETTQALSREPSLLAPSPGRHTAEQASLVANFFTNESVRETGNQNTPEALDQPEIIGIATSPRAPLRTPGAPLRQPVSKTYARRQGSSLPISRSLCRLDSSKLNFATPSSHHLNLTTSFIVPLMGLDTEPLSPVSLIARQVSFPTQPEALPTGPVVEELGCSDSAQRMPRHSFDSNTSQASTTLTRATLSFSDLVQTRPNESIVEELSDPARLLHLRSDSRDSQASNTLTRIPVACRESTQPLPAEFVIEELKCSDLIDSPSGRSVSSASLASTTSITRPNTSPSLQLCPRLQTSSTLFTSSTTLLTATPSQCSSLPFPPPTLATPPHLPKSSSSSTSPPPLLTSSKALDMSTMHTSEIANVSPSLPASSSLPSTCLFASSLSPRSSTVPRLAHECEQSKSVMAVSMPCGSPSSIPRRRALTLNPVRQRSPCGSIALNFPDAQSIVDQYEAHGPSSLRRHPTFDEDDRPISPTVSSPNFRFCAQPCGSSNSCASLARVPRACGCPSSSSRSVPKRPNLTKANSTSHLAMVSSRIQEEEETGDQISAADTMTALSVLLRNNDATIRAQSETIRAQADLLVESERRLAQWKSDHCRHLEEEKSEENGLKNLFLPVLTALQAAPDDLRLTCEAALAKMRKAWEAERAAVQADHAKLQFQLVETRKNYERAYDQLAVVRRAIESDSVGA